MTEIKVTKDVYPFTDKNKIWIPHGETVTVIEKQEKVAIVEYKGNRYPVDRNFLIEVLVEDPKEKPQPAAAEIKKEPAPVFRPIPGKLKQPSKQTKLF